MAEDRKKVVLLENFIIKVVDRGDTCDVLIRDVTSKHEAHVLAQAVAKLMVAVADMLTKSEWSCGHMACVFNGLGEDTIAEFRVNYPKEFEEARRMAKQEVEAMHHFMNKGRDDGEPIH